MDHAITVGMVVCASLSVIGIVGFIAACLLFLSIFADAFKH